MSVEHLEEIWKDIEGFSNYQVSNLGRVRNKKFDRILSQATDSRGYCIVGLYINNKPHMRLVHMLVALAFLGDKRPCQVNHIDGNKKNNRIDNLEWSTQSDNMRHSYENGLHTSAHKIRVIETGQEFNSISDCGKALQLDARRISECLNDNHPRDMYNGYHFEFVRKATKDNKPVRVKILETGEIFDSAGQCARAVGCDIGDLLRTARDGGSRHGLHFEILDGVGKKEIHKNKLSDTKSFLYDFQLEAVKNAFNGSVFNGDVGSGKSRTGLFYYFQLHGGWIDENGYVPMENPKDLYIITTAMKRDKAEWNGELIPFQMYPKPELNRYNNKIIIDSWNNIKKYVDVKNSFFIFDEQRVVGSGSWVRSFLKIAKNNEWIMLSATVGDTWMDYIPLFIANGFYKNRTDFIRQHVEYDPYCKNFPKVKGYRNTGRLIRLRNKILIDMDFKRPTVRHNEDVYCSYDVAKYKDAIRKRWDPYKDEPIQQAAGLCYVLRKIVNSDESRQIALLELLEDHPKAIIFYSFDYERDILLNLGYEPGTEIAEWTGHAHQPIPTGDKWVYIVQYQAGCEGWNTITTDTTIFYSQNYSYKVLAQASGRIDRLNTKFVDLYYYHLKSRSGIDLAITKAIRDKKIFNEGRYVERSTNWFK